MLVPVVAFLAMSAAPASGTPSAAPVNPGPALKERKICRSEELIGSTVPKRVCKTKSEWEGQGREKPDQQAERDAKPTPPRGGASNE
jgi:hypothetical protein